MTQTSRERATATIAVACLATAMLMLDISVINTALSRIANDLSTGLSGLQWIVDGYTLPMAAVVLSAGVLSDRVGRRRLFCLGLVLFTGASVLCGVSPSIGVLDGARAVQGTGAAILFATSLPLIAGVTPTAAERGRALAAWGATIGGAFAIGPFVGGVLTDLFGWRAIFLVNLPLGLVALWLAVTRVAESSDPRARRIDWPGQLTLVPGLFGLVLGLLRSGADGWSAPVVWVSLLAGVGLLGAFVATQVTREEPMLPMRLFRQPDFAGVQLSVFAISASLFSLFLYLSLYLQGPLGRSPLGTGLAYLPGTGLMFVASAMTPRLSARIGSGRVPALGMAAVVAGILLLLLGGASSSWPIILPGFIVACLGTGLFNPSISGFAMTALAPDQSGLASGAFDTFRQAGIAVGVAALGAMVPANALAGGRPEAFVAGLHHAELVAAGVAAVGMLAAAVLLPGGLRRRAPAVTVQPART